MLTLFTKSPLPPKANSGLLRNFGYLSSRGNNRLELHTTVSATEFNQLKGKQGLKIDIQKDRINLISSENEILGYWNRETLKKTFEKKLPKLLYIKADSKGTGKNEEFWYNEGWLLEGFDFDNFVKLLKEGTVKVDIRIGQYRNGRTHDHGTAFRILPSKLELCFSKREKVL
jgi:hypothetical protein